MSGTDDLIESLTAEAKPVKRLAPPLLRAGLWLGGCLFLFALWVIARNRWQPMLPRLEDSRFALELTALNWFNATGLPVTQQQLKQARKAAYDYYVANIDKV